MTTSKSAIPERVVRIRPCKRWVGELLMRCSLSGGGESVLPGTAAEWEDALAPLVAGGLEAESVQPLKHSGGVSVHRVALQIAGRTFEVVAKQGHPRGLQRKLAAMFLNCRERRGFACARALLREGIPTARPVALLASRAPVRRGWLVTEYLPDLVDFDHVAMGLLGRVELCHQRRVRDGLIRAVSDLGVALERAAWAHRDYKASNIMLQDWDGCGASPRAVLLDLEGLSRVRAASVRRRNRQLARLAASLIGYPSVPRTDYARYLQMHLEQCGGSRDDWRASFREIAAAAEAYNRAAAPRRHGKLAGYGMD